MSRYKTYKYDTTKYPFKDILTNFFLGECGFPIDPYIRGLEDIHCLTKEHYDIFEVGKDSSTVFHNKFYERYHRGWSRLQDLYDAFIKEIIAPNFNEDILYQKFPTFRVHLPKNICVGGWHNDGEYHHPAGEINYVMPLTNSEDTASIWCESEPNKKDFKPMLMRTGEYVQFNGNVLTHGNHVNKTEHTRVSMDFRVLPASKYNEAEVNESITQKTKFKEGAYYKRLSK